MVSGWPVNGSKTTFSPGVLAGKTRMGKQTDGARSSIGRSIRAQRMALHLSQRDLARVARTTAAAISHIERGIRQPSAGLLSRIGEALGISVDQILAGTVARAKESLYQRRVATAMRVLATEDQKQVADFCEYLLHRTGKSKG